MAISEACQVWIEQRIEEELEVQSHTGKSLRAIGKDIAKEIERVFEAKVNPETLRKKAERMGGTNVPPQATNESHKEIQKNQEIKMQHGGIREGAGRKAKGGEEEDSDALFQLKKWWRRANRRDRKLFREWIEEKEGGR